MMDRVLDATIRAVAWVAVWAAIAWLFGRLDRTYSMADLLGVVGTVAWLASWLAYGVGQRSKS